jgi:putative ABC transport system permease protein
MYWISEAQTSHWDDPVYEAGEIWSHYLYNIVIWAPGNPPGIEEKVRKALASVDPDLVLYGTDSYDKVFRADFQQQGMIATLTTLFGALGLVLSAIGLYGVMAYMVEQRTGEIGVRMALGADRGRVLRMVLRGAFSQVAIGLAIGIPAAIGARQADDATIVQRKTLGSGHAGLGHVGLRTGSVARVRAACLARCGRGTHGGAAE